jgi:hypothetical protein
MTEINIAVVCSYLSRYINCPLSGFLAGIIGGEVSRVEYFRAYLLWTGRNVIGVFKYSSQLRQHISFFILYNLLVKEPAHIIYNQRNSCTVSTSRES